MDKKLKEKIENWFVYHIPTSNQIDEMVLIRRAGKQLALQIAATDMEISDKMVAIRKIREAVMTANAGIVCNEKVADTPTPEDVKKSEEEDWFKGYPVSPAIPPARIWPTSPYPVPWNVSLPCSYCLQPMGIVGSWTCPVCGRYFANPDPFCGQTNGTSLGIMWKSDACGLNENNE